MKIQCSPVFAGAAGRVVWVPSGFGRS